MKSISMEIKTEIDDNDLQAGLSVLEEMDESFFNQGSFPMWIINEMTDESNWLWAYCWTWIL